MQNIRYLTVNKSDLAWLFHTSEATVEKWKKSGLHQKSDGKFLLSDALAWLKEQHRIELQNKLTAATLDQQQLSKLLGVTRQTVTAWSRAGLLKNRDGGYDLKRVCCWLREYYQRIAERNYQGRLKTIRRKIHKNVKQIEKFLDKDNLF